MKIPIFGKSLIKIFSDNHIQQFNIVVTINGKNHLIEYANLIKDNLSDRPNFLINLHEKIIKIDPNLNEYGYILDKNNIIDQNQNQNQNNLVSKVIIKEIIINIEKNDNLQEIIPIELLSENIDSYTDKGIIEASVPASYIEYDKFNIIEIPLEAVRKFAKSQNGNAYFEGRSNDILNSKCEFQPIKTVLVNYGQYKYPVISQNNWTDKYRDLIDFDIEFPKDKIIESRPFSNNLSLVTPTKIHQKISAENTGIKNIQLLNGSLDYHGDNVNYIINDNIGKLIINANVLDKIKISSSAIIPASKNLYFLVKSSGLCNNQQFILNIKYSNGDIITLFGYVNKSIELDSKLKQAVDYEVIFNNNSSSMICNYFDFEFISIYERYRIIDNNFLKDELFIKAKRELDVSDININKISNGLIGVKNHNFNSIDDKNLIQLEFIIPNNLIYLDSMEFFLSGILNNKNCNSFLLKFEFENNIFYTPNKKIIPQNNSCLFQDLDFKKYNNFKLLKVYIDLISLEKINTSSFKIYLTGMFKSPATDRLFGESIGFLNVNNVNLSNNELDFEQLFDATATNQFLINIFLPKEISLSLSNPDVFFIPLANPFFSVKEIFITANEKNLIPLLINLNEKSILKPSLFKYFFIILFLFFIFIYFKKLIKFIKHNRYFLKLKLTFENLNNFKISNSVINFIYFIIPFFHIVASLIFPAKEIIISLIFFVIIIFYLLNYLNPHRLLNFNNLDSSSTQGKITYHILILSTIFSILFLLGRLLSPDYNTPVLFSMFIFLFMSLGFILFSNIIIVEFRRIGLFKLLSALFIILFSIVINDGNSMGWYTVLFCFEFSLLSLFIRYKNYRIIFNLIVIFWFLTCIFFYLQYTLLSSVFALTVISLLFSFAFSFCIALYKDNYIFKIHVK
jgi:hypothetical protein